MLEITMPQAGQTMEEGTIIQWFKSPGDTVKKGEVLAEIETDKAVFEFESPEAGTLLKIVEPEMAVVSVHKVIALIGAPGEDPDAYLASRAAALPAKPSADAAAPKTADVAEKPTAESAPTQARTAAPSSPAARKAAGDLGVDLAAIPKGSGPGGRILSSDVAKAQGAGAPVRPSTGATRRPMSKMRKAIASTLQLSKQTIPHFYMRLTIDAAPLMAFCQAEKARYACGINDVVVLACSRAIAEFPAFRSRIEQSDILESADANIGIAVALDEGLVVPVVVGADRMDLERLAGEIRRVVAAARGGKLEGIGRATFTVTNLGMFGVEEFAAIINPPETAILAVGAVREEAIVTGGVMRPGRVMTMVLSCDHRIIDGAIAARFLARLRELLERPAEIR